MGETKERQDQSGRRFSQEQYDMLERCSEKRDVTEWNDWRQQNYKVDVLLEGANLSGMYLRNAELAGGGRWGLEDGETGERLSGELYLCNANFFGAELNGANLSHGHLEEANLSNAWLTEALLQHAHLTGAKLKFAHMEGADVGWTHLEDADFEHASVDGRTLLGECHVNRRTNFRGVGLDNTQIYPATKQLLEYNIRRRNWEDWYKEHRILTYVAKPFWWVSDYGLSAGRIAAVFIGSAVAFAAIYYLWAMMAPPGIVDNLLVDESRVTVKPWLVPLRSLFFSLVTMTVGFTDMHANPHSVWAYLLVTFQMLLGYVLLGALVTRFALLFTAGGPAGRFASERRTGKRLQESVRRKERAEQDG